ncbi:MAG: hypothetical protein ABFD46_10120 [Armatimonadota bacterium]
MLSRIAVIVSLTMLASGLFASTARVSISSDGVEGNSFSRRAQISGDGRFIVYESEASNLVPNDTNGRRDVFIYDRSTRTVELVSVSSEGAQSNEACLSPSISADGRYVVFMSWASNLVPNFEKHYYQVYIRDLQKKTTELVSISPSGEPANGESGSATISADGKFIAYRSYAKNLVVDDTNEKSDIFVYDRITRKTERVSVSTQGKQGNGDCRDSFRLVPVISADGRFVAFSSESSNLVPHDTNHHKDVFVRDRVSQTTERVSVSSQQKQANSDCEGVSVSADGRFVVFNSSASNLVKSDTNKRMDVFIHDRNSKTTELVSVSTAGLQANENCCLPSVSADGNLVVFESFASNLAGSNKEGRTCIFLRDRLAGTTKQIDVPVKCAQLVDDSSSPAVGDSGRPVITGDGRFIIFESFDPNLVPNDTNEYTDVFICDVLSAGKE